jgi:hypothetical protein
VAGLTEDLIKLKSGLRGNEIFLVGQQFLMLEV